ncbi:hypothetical protein EV424DRAFT_1566438 [Suillus variegatus]|nr:hypothetical protein EV424DRAFT_1566438 [Suillus variegatus]
MSENTTTVASSAPLHISSIVIHLDDTSSKKIDFAELKFDLRQQEIHHSSQHDKHLSAKFDPAIAVITEQVSLVVHCYYTIGTLPWKTTKRFSLNRKDVLSNAEDHNGKPEYRMTEGTITVVITISSHVCEHRRGEAEIDKEFIAPENELFVLHDSQGFEAGDSKTFKTARDFIDRRRKEPKLQDKIHAVWLCLLIPHADGHLLESGAEEFLKLRKEILGDILIIAVFTKHDVFVNKLELEAVDSDQYDEVALKELKVNTLDKLCIQPLKEVAGSDILHATVSTNEEYENTIRQLVDLTTTNIEKYVAKKQH